MLRPLIEVSILFGSSRFVWKFIDKGLGYLIVTVVAEPVTIRYPKSIETQFFYALPTPL